MRYILKFDKNVIFLMVIIFKYVFCYKISVEYLFWLKGVEVYVCIYIYRVIFFWYMYYDWKVKFYMLIYFKIFFKV